jgi:hypothetical protein
MPMTLFGLGRSRIVASCFVGLPARLLERSRNPPFVGDPHLSSCLVGLSPPPVNCRIKAASAALIPVNWRARVVVPVNCGATRTDPVPVYMGASAERVGDACGEPLMPVGRSSYTGGLSLVHCRKATTAEAVAHQTLSTPNSPLAVTLGRTVQFLPTPRLSLLSFLPLYPHRSLRRLFLAPADQTSRMPPRALRARHHPSFHWRHGFVTARAGRPAAAEAGKGHGR